MKSAKLVAVLMIVLCCQWAVAQPSISSITPTTLSVSVGATATFRVTATGASPFTYQWWFTNTLGDNAIDGVANPSALRNILNFTNVQVASAGGYYVVVTDANSLSATSGVATLTVDSTFTKITEGPIVNDRLTSSYGCWGDYDNDGRLDVLLSGDINQWRLYHNDGGAMFSTVTNGVLGEYNLRAMWGIWADPDNDDDLDVFALGQSVGTSYMFLNDGSGDFTRVPMDGWVVMNNAGAWGDYDQDGFIDAFFGTARGGINALLHNNGDGTFSRVTNSILNLRADKIMVSCAVDYDNDGDLDLVLVRWEGRRTQFYRNDGHGTFAEATPEPIRSELTYSLSAAWGTSTTMATWMCSSEGGTT